MGEKFVAAAVILQPCNTFEDENYVLRMMNRYNEGIWVPDGLSTSDFFYIRKNKFC